MNPLSLLGRSSNLFDLDIKNAKDLDSIIKKSSFLVLGGAGSIGQSVTKEIFSRNPKKLHIVDISENNLAELVRDIRSSLGYISGDFKTYAIDIGSIEYDYFIKSDGKYDYVLNLSALKHVRSEKDKYTLMRMIDVNIFNTIKTIKQSISNNTKKYFCVSTDKATNPVNMMGASKRIMEIFLNKYSDKINISTARFANVAFSDGSLMHSFNQRFNKCQPIVAPDDIQGYFITEKESGELCLLSCIYGENNDIFFPKLLDKLHLIKFSDIAINFLDSKGYKPFICNSEEEARNFKINSNDLTWPCLFTQSDTSGEKDFEEFFSLDEQINFEKFNGLGIVKNNFKDTDEILISFKKNINKMRNMGSWRKEDILKSFQILLPNFSHIETGKYLDSKM